MLGNDRRSQVIGAALTIKQTQNRDFQILLQQKMANADTQRMTMTTGNFDTSFVTETVTSQEMKR